MSADQPAGDVGFRCKGVNLAVATDAEVRAEVPRGVTLQAIHWPIFRSDHARLDARSLAMHRLVARKLLEKPALLDLARENLARWQKIDGSPSRARAEWAEILAGSVEQGWNF
jgi:hypothetical protein